MIKLEIWPSFINKSLFELKNRDSKWELIVFKDSFEFLNDKGYIWKASNIDSLIVEEIIKLSKEIIDNPPENVLGIDGVSSKLLFEDKVIKFWSPKKNTKELELVSLFFELIDKNISEANCIDYMDLLSQYFFDIIPIKEFDEEIYRLKVFGGLTIRDLEILSKKIENLKTKDLGILDMTNFLTTGSILNQCFWEIKDKKNIKILVNKNAYNYLKAIGFEDSQMEEI